MMHYLCTKQITNNIQYDINFKIWCYVILSAYDINIFMNKEKKTLKDHLTIWRELFYSSPYFKNYFYVPITLLDWKEKDMWAMSGTGFSGC